MRIKVYLDIACFRESQNTLFECIIQMLVHALEILYMVSTRITAILNFYDPDHSEFYFPSLGISNNKHTQLEIEVDGHFPIIT